MAARNADTWRRKASELGKLLKDGGEEEKRMSEALGYLSSLMYPLEGLTTEVIEVLLRQFAEGRCAELSSECTVMLGRLVSNLITYQKASLSSSTQEGLLSVFLSRLTSVRPPTELLYACAALAQAGTTHCQSQDVKTLLESSGTVVNMATTGSVDVQRAALNYISTLCQDKDFKGVSTPQLLELLLSAFLSPTKETDTLLQIKLVFSQLKCLQALLSRSPVLQSSPHLTNLLAVLRAAMTLGLPGQPHTLQAALPLALPVVQSPKIVTPPPPSPKQRPQIIAGPQPRRRQKRAKDQKHTNKIGRSHESSDGEASLGDHVKLRPSVSFGGRGCSWSSSESDVSDSEPAPSQIKVVHGKIRHLAFSCLTAVFKSLDTHTKFSFGLTFLPDGPRPPNSPPSLMTCVLKDPLPKCRGGALSVLFTLLEGSKVYLAPADDRPRPSQAFTPYSVTLGNIVQELHRSLLLAMATESQHNTLTQVVHTLAQLVANCPYHQLSDGYVRRVTVAIERYSTHRDTNVQVACLTCAGAVVSISPPLPEVINWITNEGGSPWILEFCLILLQTQSNNTCHSNLLLLLEDA
ncbi:HEAT repeat-containing protein 6-like isoform X3 [Halichondria panicea]|uniref:HEAT repeat-containing protein 6-like isoform X3 n=1 Tax=Halichondria panicea TaxID=6063 RepID=UPI00312BA3BA